MNKNVATIGTRASGKTVSDLTLAYKLSLKSDVKFMFLDFHGEADYNLEFIKPKLLSCQTVELSDLHHHVKKPKATLTVVRMYGHAIESMSETEVENILMNMNSNFDGFVIYEALMLEKYIRIKKLLRSSFVKAIHVAQFTNIGDITMYSTYDDYGYIKLHRTTCSFERYKDRINKFHYDLLQDAHRLVTKKHEKDRHFFCVVDMMYRNIYHKTGQGLIQTHRALIK